MREALPAVALDDLVVCDDFGSHIPDVSFVTVAVGSVWRDDQKFKQVCYLRGRRFLDLGYILPSDVDDEGSEFPDDDDDRAMQVGAFIGGRAVSTSRLIYRGDCPLPCEHYFPELRYGIPPNSFEVSRFIAWHEDVRTQGQLSAELTAAVWRVGLDNDCELFMTVERSFALLLKRLGVVLEQIGAPLSLERYNHTVNAPYRVVTADSFEYVKQRDQGRDFKVGDLWNRVIGSTNQQKIAEMQIVGVS